MLTKPLSKHLFTIKYCLSLTICSLFIFMNAQAQKCEVPSNIAAGKLNIQFAKTPLQKGTHGQIISYVKTPKTSTEVNDADFITCDGFMPNRAKIRSIKVVSVSGLPEGLKWHCNTDDCLWTGNQTGCFFIEGQTEKVGTFPLEITVEGVGSLFGIKKKYDCYLKDYEVVVE